MIIETERLVVRNFSLGDTASLFSILSDPEVMKHMNGRTPMSRQKNLWRKQGSLRSQLYMLTD